MFSRTVLNLSRSVKLASSPNTKFFLRHKSRLPPTICMNSRSFADDKKNIRVTFVRSTGERLTATGKVGDNLLDVVVNNNIDLDGFGACEGTLTCSTCHLILSKSDYDKLPTKPGDEEMDMLDLAYDLCDTSRLGCQVVLSEDMDGLEVKVPTTVNDARS